MAKNPPTGDRHRHSAVKDRTQVLNPKTNTWTKRDSDTGRFMDGKKDGATIHFGAAVLFFCL